MVSPKATLIFTFWLSASTFFIILTVHKSDGFKATEYAYLDHVICRFNSRLTRNCTCKLNFITRLTKSLTVKCYINQTIEDALGTVQLYYKFRNGYQQFLINGEVNLCQYFTGKAKSLIIDMVWPTFKKYFEIDQNFTCPFYGRCNLNNMPLTPQLFNNMFVPAGNYMANISALLPTKELIWNGKFYFNIPEGKTIEDDRMGR